MFPGDHVGISTYVPSAIRAVVTILVFNSQLEIQSDLISLA